ncbi:hypothetical protein AB434_2243 [Heyndrickxia coagulans]|uniref:Uncharacterized protein n=1 Tax=Heyndrickxia coagulans TaxID=1398 RepID=A0AAN0T6R1_HEYCO|nr:hypothetical protein SB48_HM08orf04905 [Heyndrickxia coagulans]AKN54648.1 hypothetical protein AB434_2243 [Heyndrickxia coagulans]
MVFICNKDWPITAYRTPFSITLTKNSPNKDTISLHWRK